FPQGAPRLCRRGLASGGGGRGDRRRGPKREPRWGRPRLDVSHPGRDAQQNGCAPGGGRGEMKTADLLIAVNTVWVVVAAVLVMFMQAGFAFLEAGLTRMKNAPHIAGKNLLIFGICSLVYWAVGFGLAFGNGNAIVGTSGFFPSFEDLLGIATAPFSFFGSIPAGAGHLVGGVFARGLL